MLRFAADFGKIVKIIDIAVGAPYEDNGAVYIYLGGPNGIISKPSQRLAAPYNGNVAPFTPHMFGHGLSKGSDIDGNYYLGNIVKRAAIFWYLNLTFDRYCRWSTQCRSSLCVQKLSCCQSDSKCSSIK